MVNLITPMICYSSKQEYGASIMKKELIRLLPDFELPEQEVSLIYPTRKQISRLSRVYIDYCIEHAKQYL